MRRSARADVQPNLETKGIASFRSPVSNLNAHRKLGTPEITHDDFVRAVREEFERVYAKHGSAVKVFEVDEIKVDEPKVWKGVEELKVRLVNVAAAEVRAGTGSMASRPSLQT